MYPQEMMTEQVWFDRPKYEAEMDHYQLFLTKNLSLELSTKTVEVEGGKGESSIAKQIAKARDNIKQTLSGQVTSTSKESQPSASADLMKENAELRKLVEALSAQVAALDLRVKKLEDAPTAESKPADVTEPKQIPAAPKDDDDDDDDDLFGDDSDDDDSDEEEETEEQKAIREKRLAAYAAKKANKKAVIAKSSLLLDVKPWDDETDMAEMERLVKTIEADGLLWGASKLVPLAYGIRKLQINAVIEDDKISTDFLEEEITKFSDYVQSMDIAAFNKI